MIIEERLSEKALLVTADGPWYTLVRVKPRGGVLVRKTITGILVTILVLHFQMAGAVRFMSTDVPEDTRYVDMGKNQISDWKGFYAFLDQLPELEKVDMFATPVWKNRIQEMAERYPEIEFGWTIRFSEHTVRTDATAFSTLHLSGSQTHSVDEIGLVRYCRQLRALDFGHNGVKDLSFLYDLPELRVLIIAINRVEDITPIASLKHLEYLEIFTNYITDLTPLLGLNHLMDLNIGFNFIADLSPLTQMKQLRRLWMYNCIDRYRKTPIPEDQLQTIREALPETEINIRSNPSEGGWRDHHHFDVIHRMFRTGVYEPFEDSWPEGTDKTVSVADAVSPDLPISGQKGTEADGIHVSRGGIP